MGTETRPQTLPPTLTLVNVSTEAALTAIADRLTEIAADRMPRLAELICELDISGDGRASLQFRACK